MDKKIKQALVENRIDIYYQPILSTKSNKIEKIECLVRFLEENGDVISPNFFLHVAKRSRLYNEITKFVISKACETFASRTEKFSINLSIEDIIESSTIQYLIKEVKKHALENRMVIEILESEGIDNYAQVIEVIEELKSFGIEIAIDDFGTGYSNFSHLVSLDIDILKIDGSLIKDLHVNASARSIVRSILSFTQELGIKTVAEFVSSKELYDIVKELGVDYAQGYYISKPLSKIELDNLS